MTTAAVTRTRPKGAVSIRDNIQSPEYMDKLKELVPKHLDSTRFKQSLLYSLTRTPALATCDQKSFFRCASELAKWGLEADGYSAHLIPFKNRKTNTTECQLIIDYKGLVELILRTGMVSRVYSEKVCEGDEFEFNKGQIVKHVIDFRSERGEAYAYYCEVTLKDGTVIAACMSKHEVDDIKKRSKSPNNGPWATDYDEMAKKTVFKRLAKWLPRSSEIREALRFEDEEPTTKPARVDNVTTAQPALSDKGFIAADEPEPEPEPEEEPPAEPEGDIQPEEMDLNDMREALRFQLQEEDIKEADIVSAGIKAGILPKNCKGVREMSSDQIEAIQDEWFALTQGGAQ